MYLITTKQLEADDMIKLQFTRKLYKEYDNTKWKLLINIYSKWSYMY